MHAYSFGIEEEFFVFDARSRRAVRRMGRRFHAAAKRALQDRVSREMLQSQIELVTPPCTSTAEARTRLTEGRHALAALALEHDLGVAAMGTFPLAFWPEMRVTPKARYDAIIDDLQMVGMRNMMCGMHVHVEVSDIDQRINLMMRLTPYLPLLLALSASSPFWQGHFTGLHGYRLAAYDELPRTGLPELFRTEADYAEYVDALARAGIIPDASYIWWAMRPSLKYPTIELRAADCCTSIADALGIAALFRCLVRRLERDRNRNAGFDRVGRAITAENKWRAQRYGVGATVVEPMDRRAITMAEWLDGVLELVVDDAAALGCESALARLPHIVRGGGSADRQIAVYQDAISAGKPRSAAVREVIDWAARETVHAEASPPATGHL